MAQTISDRVLELGFSLPAPAKAVGNYAPRLRIGNMLYISGQLPNSEFCNGSTAVKAAQLCAMNLIAQIAAEVGDDLSQIAHIVRLGGFVNAHRNFSDHTIR